MLSTLTADSYGEVVQYHHPDRLGTRLVTNAADTNSFEQATLPYGTALGAESSGATNRRFTSYDRSNVTGLDYAVNRHYDSQQGRFTQVDPIGMRTASLEHPQTLNLYSYCGNDPVNHLDPSGLFFGFLKRLFRRVVHALVQAVIAAVITFIISGFNVAAAIGAGAAAFAKDIGWPSKGWLPSIGRSTPPTFQVGRPTLSQIIQSTPIGRQLTPNPRDFLTPGFNPYAPRPFDAVSINDLLFPCKVKNTKITHYDQPKGNTAIAGTRPVEGRTVAADPAFFGLSYPRGRGQSNDDVKTVAQTQKRLRGAGIVFDIPGVGRRRFEDVGGGVRGAWIDVYVEQGAKQLGTFTADVIVYVPIDIPCPAGSQSLNSPIIRK